MMTRLRIRLLAPAMLALSALVAPAAPAHAQADAALFPARAVRIVVPFPPGGSTDITARLVAARLQQIWQQPVTVDNKPGAAANIGTETVAHSAADGHTILLGTTALPISAATFDKLGYDPVKDLLPVMLVSTIANVLVVNPSLPVDSVQAFIDYAKANPGKLNYASPGAATGQRLTFELLKQTTGIDIVHIPYKGGAPAGQAVLAGEVECMMMNVVEATPLLQAGRLRALAVTSRERAPQLPAVPTLHETVSPGVDSSVWQGVLVPAGTPPAVVDKINRGWREAIGSADIRDRLEGMGMKLAAGTPAEFAAFLKAEFAQWAQVAKTGNIKAE